MGQAWYSDSMTIADMKDKSAAEKLQGIWIMELSELAGIRKVEVETVKSFYQEWMTSIVLLMKSLSQHIHEVQLLSVLPIQPMDFT